MAISQPEGGLDVRLGTRASDGIFKAVKGGKLLVSEGGLSSATTILAACRVFASERRRAGTDARIEQGLTISLSTRITARLEGARKGVLFLC